MRADERLNVLVISTGPATGAWLEERLDARRFSVGTAQPGPDLIRAVREAQPQIAVLDGIDARPELARLEVALLKDRSPGVQIIALSAQSSELDVEVIEQGVFCYLGGCSLEELLRVVESAARGRAEDRTHPHSNLRSVP
jgi:DNA-binding response OmpR family regulator